MGGVLDGYVFGAALQGIEIDNTVEDLSVREDLLVLPYLMGT